MREPDVLYATIRRVDPGFDVPIDDVIKSLIRNGEAQTKSAGKRWRFRLAAFGEGQPAPEGGPYMVVQMRHVAAFLMQTMREHHMVWKDAQFGDPVLDLLHMFDKMGFAWTRIDREEEELQRLEEEERRKPKPRQNEKVTPVSKPRVKSARKNGVSPHIEVVPPVKAARAKTPRVKAESPKPARKRTVSNDGWIPGAG